MKNLQHLMNLAKAYDDGAPRQIAAKFPGRCKICNRSYKVGEKIDYYPKARSVACAGGSCSPKAPKAGAPQEGSED